MLNQNWTIIRAYLGIILTIYLPASPILASEWSLQLNPFVGSGHSSFSSVSQSISGAMIGVHRNLWQTDEFILAPSLALHSLHSYFTSNTEQNSQVSNNRHMNALLGLHVESRVSYSILELKPFADLGLGYGRSEIKITDNDAGSYTEFAYDDLDSYLLKMTLGAVHALNERLSLSLAYNYLQVRYKLASTPDSSYQESLQSGFGLRLSDSPQTQETHHPRSGSQNENIHSAQLGLSIKL